MGLLKFIKSDLYRYYGTNSGFVKLYLFNKGFRLLCLHRLGNSIKFNPIIFIFKIYYQHIQNKYTINIPLSVKLGYGIYIGHTFAIAINKRCTIGNNVNISQCVTIGIKQTGKKQGVPVLGNNIYIGPGSTIIGGVIIGDNVVIGANSVVTKDIPNDAVVVGVPATILSYTGTKGVVNNKWETKNSLYDQ